MFGGAAAGAGPYAGEPMSQMAVLFEGVSYAYPGGAVALENVSISIPEGEMLAIVGPNGGGKSTLIKIMMGLIEGYRGRVEVFGSSPRDAQRRGLIGYVAQRSEAELGFPISGRQAVLMAAARHVPAWKSVPKEVRDRVERSLEVVHALDYADRPVGSLSGGQLQRVLIARALALGPRILALDEPLVGVDAAGQERFKELLARLRSEMKLTILLVSHDLRTVAGGASVCDRVACLRRTLHFHASPAGVTPQVLAEVFQHDLADIFGDVHVDAHAAADCPGGHQHVHVRVGAAENKGPGA